MFRFEPNRDRDAYSPICLFKMELGPMNVKASEAAEESLSRPVEEDAATSSFAEVARKITGADKPPAWLVETFERWAPSLAMARAIAVKQPTKAKTRKSLQAVTDAAHTLIDRLASVRRQPRDIRSRSAVLFCRRALTLIGPIHSLFRSSDFPVQAKTVPCSAPQGIPP